MYLNLRVISFVLRESGQQKPSFSHFLFGLRLILLQKLCFQSFFRPDLGLIG